MNENPGGTPNPLNPEPTMPTSIPEPEELTLVESEEVVEQVAPTTEPVAMSEPVATPMPTAMPEQAPTPAPTAMSEPTPTPTPTPEQTMAPATTPVEPKDSIVEPAKKKGKGGIIAAIILLIVAVGAAAAAAIIYLNPFGQNDRVPAALSKLFSGSSASKLALTGTISAAATDETNYTQNLDVSFNSSFDLKTSENAIDATVTAQFTDESEFTFDASEIHTAQGDLYLKLSGLSEALNNYTPMAENVATNCINDPTGMTNCESTTVTTTPTSSILNSLGVFEVVDDEWIKIPSSDFSNTTDIFNLDTPVQCLFDAAGKMGEYGKDFATKYEANPFINYSTENLAIAKKKNPLYRLTFDSTKLAAFVNSMSNTGLANSLVACMNGGATSTGITAEQVAEMTANFTSFYVEIDDNNNFTRVYFTMAPEGQTVTVDLSLSYPTSITITEPEQYISYSEVLQKLLSSFYAEPLTPGEMTPGATIEGEITLPEGVTLEEVAPENVGDEVIVEETIEE